MNTYSDKTQISERQSVANAIVQKKDNSSSGMYLEDNRPEMVVQRQLQEIADNRHPIQRAIYESGGQWYSDKATGTFQDKETAEAQDKAAGGTGEVIPDPSGLSQEAPAPTPLEESSSSQSDAPPSSENQAAQGFSHPGGYGTYGSPPMLQSGAYRYQPMPQGNGYGYSPMPQGGGYGYSSMPQGGGYGYSSMPQGGGYGYSPMPQGGGSSAAAASPAPSKSRALKIVDPSSEEGQRAQEEAQREKEKRKAEAAAAKAEEARLEALKPENIALRELESAIDEDTTIEYDHQYGEGDSIGHEWKIMKGGEKIGVYHYHPNSGGGSSPESIKVDSFGPKSYQVPARFKVKAITDLSKM